MAFPKPDSYKTHNGPRGSRAAWKDKARTLLTGEEESKGAIAESLVILGLTGQPTAMELRRAYKRAASKAHPDRGGSDEAFRAVQEAFNTLSEAAWLK